MALNFANNNSLSAITTKPSGLSGGTMNLISTQTASSSSTISFTSGIDSTYDEYVFKFYNIHPSTAAQLKCNFSVDGGSNYNVTKTTTSFVSQHAEDNSVASVVYQAVRDLAQSTSDMWISSTLLADNDGNFSGSMTLYNPSSTTFVKHFISRGNSMNTDPGSVDDYFAGYGNTTSAINAVIFRMSSGNIDSGVIKLYGVS